MMNLPDIPTSNYHGFQRQTFPFASTEATVITPKEPNTEKKFLWKGFYLEAFPAFDLAALEAGYYVVHIQSTKDIPISETIGIWNKFYDYLREEFGLAEKAALFGLSLGGWFIYQWAAAHPEKVSCLYADNPVCDCRDEILAPMASAHIPILHVAATGDTVVNYEKNTVALAERYRALGGNIEVIAHPGDHHPHGLEDPGPILDFVTMHI